MAKATGLQELGDGLAVYRDHDRSYPADSCSTLVEAAARGDVRMVAMGRRGYPGERWGKEDLPGLCSVGFWDAGPGRKWGLPEHRNEGLELTFMASGHSVVAVESWEHLLEHDHILVTRPWQPHRIGNPAVDPCRLAWMIIDLRVRQPHQEWHWPGWIVLGSEDLAFLTRCLRTNEQAVWPAHGEARRGFARLIETLEKKPSPGRLSRIAVHVNEILLGMLEFFRHNGPVLRPSLTTAERTIRMFIVDLEGSLREPWTVENMAETCRMGVTAFIAHFRSLTNRTPARWLLEARVKAASELLANHPGMPVHQIAKSCGFSSSQYFATSFARVTGQSPSDFRA